MLDLIKTLLGSLAGPIFIAVGIFYAYFVFSKMGVNFLPVLSFIVALSPIWLPIALFFIMFEQWMTFVRAKFRHQNGRTTLRIKLPQEVLKSPEAMESVLAQIHNPNNPDNLMQTYLDGKCPLMVSLELVSIGGEVRFYANVATKKTKNAIESQLYAQYPGVEVVEELIDYTSEIAWDPTKWDIMSFHLGKKKDSVYPIKTYIDFGLDKQPKEELKFEPMAATLESLGKAKPHERIWIQILMYPHVERIFKNGYLKDVPSWDKTAKKEVDKIMGRDKKGLGTEETELRPTLTSVERDTISAMERNVGKYAYEVAIRGMYIVPPDKFNPDMIATITKAFAQFDVLGRNAIGPRWRTDFDYNFFSDPTGSRKLKMKKDELEDYKRRHYEPADKEKFIDAPKVMSVEELASMFHLPGTSVVTPNLTRVESTRKSAPANLPTGNGEWG